MVFKGLAEGMKTEKVEKPVAILNDEKDHVIDIEI